MATYGGVRRCESLELGARPGDVAGWDDGAVSRDFTARRRFLQQDPVRTAPEAEPWRLRSGDLFDEEAARAQVLAARPASCLVLGSRGSGAAQLARRLADQWGRVLLGPESALLSALDQSSPEGDQAAVAGHVSRRLRAGGAATPGDAWALVEQAAHAEEVRHRGYVLHGVPITPTDDGDDDAPSVEEQMDAVFGWTLSPDVLVCVACPDEDVARRRSDIRYDFHSGQEVDGTLDADDSIKVLYVRGKHLEDDLGQDKHLVRLPFDFPYKVVDELSSYRRHVQPTVDRYVQQHPPDRVIRIDGRTSYSLTFKCVKAKLDSMSLDRVYTVERMMKGRQNIDFAEDSEEFEEEEREFQNQNIYESIPMLMAKNVISPRFKWRLSPWGTTCPVALFEGRSKEGKIEHAVRFMDKLFFLSSPSELQKFTKNPRLYLSPPAPRPTGKFLVVGSVFSGKTTISNFLAQIFSCMVLNIDEIGQSFKEDEFRKTATEEARGKLREKLKIEWEDDDKSRLDKIKQWKTMILNHLNKLSEYNMSLQRRGTDKEEDYRTVENIDPSTDYKNTDITPNESNITDSLNVLNKFGIPVENDPKLLKEVLGNPELLTDYIPSYLAAKKPLLEQSGDDDSFISSYVDYAVKNIKLEELEVSPDKMAVKILENIRNAEHEKQTITHGYVKEGGWVLDGFILLEDLWHILEENECLPDKIICLIDDDPNEKSLHDRWENMNTENRLKFMQKTVKSPSSTESSLLQSTEDINNYVNDHELQSSSEFVERYLNSLQAFSEEWQDFVNSANIQDNYKEVSISNKSIDQIKDEVLKFIEHQFVEKPTDVADDDDEDEEEVELDETDRKSEDFEESEVPKNVKTTNLLGDTGMYCPVVFNKHWVLYPGNDNFKVNFMGKTFLMSSETALTEFKDNPLQFASQAKPIFNLPPPRILIVGPVGSGKTDIREFLAQHLLLAHFDYGDVIKEVLLPSDMPKFVRKIDQIEQQDDEARQETYPENITAVKEYVLDLSPLPEEMLERLLYKFWYSTPHQTKGFILEGFPHQEKDIDFMTSRITIPDIVIELQTDISNVKKRLLNTYLNPWLQDMTKRKLEWQTQLQDNQEQIKRKRDERRQELKNERMGEVVNEDGQEEESKEDLDEEVEDEIEGILDEEFPEPSTTPPEWESTEEATERILEQIESWFDSDYENIQVLKDLASEANIPWRAIATDRHPALVRREALRVVQPFVRKKSGIMYQPVRLMLDQAEKLLECGYFLPSKFSRQCPVQLREGAPLSDTFIPWELRKQVVPAALKGRVYFLSDDHNFDLFCADPIRYVDQEPPRSPGEPLRLAVLGPPKSGKSTLAGRLAGSYGLRTATLGRSGRYVLEKLGWTRLAREVQSWLKEGAELPDRLAVDCLRLYLQDPRSQTKGIVFDGCPISLDQIEALERESLQPHLVILLETDLAFTMDAEKISKERESMESWKAGYPPALLGRRWRTWAAVEAGLEAELGRRYQNLARLDGRGSAVWTRRRAGDLVFAALASLRDAWAHDDPEVPCPLRWLGVTPAQFAARQSKFQHYCCLCFLLERRLESSGLEPPPDRAGLVAWRGQHYWLCGDHLPLFLRHHRRYSEALREATFPRDLPAPCSAPAAPAEAGRCLVTYWDSLPARVVRDGSPDLAASYRGREYLFCSPECLRRFCRTPWQYCDRRIPDEALGGLPQVSPEQLPTRGYLEQTLAGALQEALTAVAATRPRHPGAGVAASACAHLALRLRAGNPLSSPEARRAHSRALRRFEARCAELAGATSRLGAAGRNPRCRRPPLGALQ